MNEFTYTEETKYPNGTLSNIYKITFTKENYKNPDFMVDILIEDQTYMYANISIPLSKLIEAVEWCKYDKPC